MLSLYPSLRGLSMPPPYPAPEGWHWVCVHCHWTLVFDHVPDVGAFKKLEPMRSQITGEIV